MQQDKTIFEKIGKDTIGDIVFVKTHKRVGLYTSAVDHKNKIIATKVLYEAEDVEDFKDILKDLDIDHIGDEDDEDTI